MGGISCLEIACWTALPREEKYSSHLGGHYTAKHAVTRVGCLQGLSSPTSFISPIKRRDSYDGGQIEYLESMEMGNPGVSIPEALPSLDFPNCIQSKKKGGLD